MPRPTTSTPPPAPAPTPRAPAGDAAAQPDVSVVIVNYNVREFLEQALRSVRRAAAGLRVETFVVDNNSVDGSVEMVQAAFPDVHVIRNDDNVGFGRANNQAIRRARGRYLLILNPDTIVQEDTLATFVRFMDAHPGAGAVGCTILNPDGTFAPESRRAFPTPSVAFWRMTGLGRFFPNHPVFGRYNLTYLPADEVAEVDALSGSCMVVRRAALYEGAADGTPGAGLFDEDFFMYGEDLDWCYRIQAAGWKIYYTPETQIIHYKGESTKKGELRYVRHFYGAMLLFTEKHFSDRYSRLFAAVLRAGIVGRAALTVCTNALRRLAVPALDVALVYLVVTAIGAVRTAQAGVALSPLFFATVAPGFALGTAAGIALTGGYPRSRRWRLPPVVWGALAGLVVVSVASFFVKSIAFSRAVVLLSGPAAALVLGAWRLAARLRRHEPQRAVVVGPAAEAARLRAMLAAHPAPPFVLLGYVDDAPADRGDGAAPPPDDALPLLGTPRQLRDLVRLRRVSDVVFAADGLANHTIFGLMQRLHDLPVQFKMLAAGREHVIGKASVEDLSLPALLPADEAMPTPRAAGADRAFEVGAALLGLAAYPVVAVLARRPGAAPFWPRLSSRLRRLPDVLRGRRALVGYDADTPARSFQPPPDWGLRPGVFTLCETLPAGLSDDERSRACWAFVRNRSVSLDWRVLVRALRALRA